MKSPNLCQGEFRFEVGIMEIAIRAPPRCYLGLALSADRLLAHLALGAAREDAEPRLLAEETQL